MVSLGALKARVSHFVHLAHSGKRFLLTDRGRPVGVLEPVTPAECLPDLVEALIRIGQIRAPLAELPDDFFDQNPP